MKIRTFSIIAGSEACNARCPFCISKMTPPLGVELKEPEVNWRNFNIACRLAKSAGVTTAMLTGKGEPTLFPKQVVEFIRRLGEHQFPLIELQTNGIPIAEGRVNDYALGTWYEHGLTTVAISIVHWLPERNREIYLPYKKDYIDLPGVIAKLHKIGLSVRLACTMLKGYVSTPIEVHGLVEFAREHGVEQLTIRPVAQPDKSRDDEAASWTAARAISPEMVMTIGRWARDNGTLVLRLPHGAEVYDVGGQNLCLTDCLTVKPDLEEMRNLIFYPDGHLRYAWQHPGAIIL